jgi:putative DNA-invertase from lambdoid prophage Rac
MKRDASLRRFDRLLVWKVSRLGRDMREVISTVYELSDLGITTVPIKSQTGPLNSSMGKLLWAVQAWFAEFENDERSENIKSGLKQALEAGKTLGRPRVDIDRPQVEALRASGASWRAIAAKLGVGVGTVHRTSQRRSKIPCGAISLNQSDPNPASHVLCGPANQ